MRSSCLWFFLFLSLSLQAQPEQIRQLAIAENVLASGDTVRALNHFKSILSNYPDSYPAALRLTEVNFIHHDLRSAIQYAYVTEDILERHLDSLQNSGIPVDEQLRKKARYTRDLSDIQSLKGKIRLKQNRPVDALHELNKALENDPDNPNIYLDLGLADYSLNRMPEARANFNKALARDSANRGALFNLGNWYNHEEKYDSAAYYYKKTIRQDPDFPYPYLYLGDVLTEEKAYDEALNYYNEYLQRDSTLAEAYFKRGVLLAEEHKWPGAREDWQKVVSLEPDNGEAWRNLGLTLFRMEEYNDAITAFDSAIARKPDPYAYINRGYCYYMNGDNRRALKDYDQGLNELPEYELGFYLRALTWQAMHKRKNACADLRKAWSLGYPHEETDDKLLKKCN